MALGTLNEDEVEEFERILKDLQDLFDRDNVRFGEVNQFCDELRAEPVKEYLDDLRDGSKPERAMSDELIAGQSLISKAFFGDASPEVNLNQDDAGSGFIDYRIDGERPIYLELKPPYKRKSNEITSIDLDPEKHRDQIEDYRLNNEFLIFTNLREWYFFSRRDEEPINEEPITLDEFSERFRQSTGILDYLERLESQSIRGSLDERFFESLQKWVDLLQDIEYKDKIDEREQLEIAIRNINKFVFIQTLDDYGAIDFKWIRDTWELKNSRWKKVGEKKVLREFLEEVDDWFHAYYDTELFKQNILEKVESGEENIEQLYQNIQYILGVKSWQNTVGERGVTNYNFRTIDEDIFGKAYETFLAEVREEQGIYYTPSYITEHISESVLENQFDTEIAAFENAVNDEEFKKADDILDDIISIRLLDPACGSGSFLIKALEGIWNRYKKLESILDEKRAEHEEFPEGQVIRSDKDRAALKNISALKSKLGTDDKRRLISKAIVRHLHGVDLDNRALEIAKLNLWLKAITLIPDEFRYSDIPDGKGYVLPDLGMNLAYGDSLMSLQDSAVIEYLNNNQKSQLEELTDLREKYLENPTTEDYISQISDKLSSLRDVLDEEFIRNMDDSELVDRIYNQKRPLYWPVHFWYCYQTGDSYGVHEDGGFDAIIGNPPYYNETREHSYDFELYKQSPTVREYYNAKIDVFYLFIQRGIDVLREGGELSFIILSYWKTRTFAKDLNKKIAHETKITDLIEFNDYKVFTGSAEGIHSDILTIEKKSRRDDPYKDYDVYVTDVNDSSLTVNSVRKALSGKSVSGVNRAKKKVTFDTESGRISLDNPERAEVIQSIEAAGTERLDSDNISTGVNTYPDKISQSDIEDLDEVPDNVQAGDGVFVLSEKELDSLKLNPREESLIKPFYRAEFVKPYYLDTRNSEEYLIYTQKNLIEYDGWDIYQKARSRLKEDGIEWSDADESTKEEYKNDVEEEFRAEIRSKYPNITEHLEKFLDLGVITSDRSPYGIHRSRDSRFFEGDGRLVSVRKTPYPRVAHPSEPCYMDEGVNVIETGYPPELAEALLNSYVLHYWFRYGFGKTQGGQLQIDKEVLEAAPLAIDTVDASPLDYESTVTELKEMKRFEDIWDDCWETVSEKMSTNERTLSERLSLDKQILQDPSTSNDRTWTTKVSFYPDDLPDEASKSLDRIRVDTDPASAELVLVGITGREEEKVLEIEFRNNFLRDHALLAIRKLMSGTQNVNSIQDILEKSTIPSIRPDSHERTKAIVDQTRDNVWSESDGPELGLPEIIENRRNLEIQLESAIFDRYGLSRQKVKSILRELEVSQSREAQILDRIDRDSRVN